MSRLLSFVVTLSLFGLGNASPANFTVTFPSTYAGDALNISWQGALPPSNISLNTGLYPSPYYEIVLDIPGSNGYYLWSIPLNLPTDIYSFHIEDSSSRQGTLSYSNVFNITQTNSSVEAFVKPTPVIFADSATATSFNVSSTSSAASTSSAPPTSPAAPSGGGHKASGLSAGAKAGIGVGAAVVALAVIGLVVFWYRKRLGTRVPQRVEVTDPHSKAELPGSRVEQKTKLGASEDFQKAELGTGPDKAELSTGPDKAEMSHVTERVELESDNPRAELAA